jgi:hypothetical protein
MEKGHGARRAGRKLFWTTGLQRPSGCRSIWFWSVATDTCVELEQDGRENYSHGPQNYRLKLQSWLLDSRVMPLNCRSVLLNR